MFFEFLLLFLPLLAFINCFKYKEYKYVKPFIILWGILLWIVIGLRTNSPAGDYILYYWDFFLNAQYSNWLDISNNFGSGLGYYALCHYLSNYPLIVAFCAAITILLFLTFIYKSTELPFLCLFFFFGYFFYQYLLEQYRQGVAISIIPWAIYFRKEKFKSSCLILLAASFHPTALIVFSIFFIPEKLQKTKVYIVLIILAFLFSAMMETIMERYSSIITYLHDRNEYYTQLDERRGRFIAIFDMAMLIRLCLFWLCFYFKDILSKQKNISFYLNLYFISFLIYKCFSFSPEIAVRGSVYFSFYEIILAANLIYVLHKKNIMKWIFMLFIGLSLYRQLKVLDLIFNQLHYTYHNLVF